MIFTAGPPIMGLCFAAVGVLAYLPRTRPLALAYLAYTYAFDKSPSTGSNKSETMRKNMWWRWFSDFFPVKLVRSTPLSPEKKYIFGYHPHGIIGVGAICSFATEAVGFSALFPGLDVFLLTLPVNFRVPIIRQIWLCMGLCDSSKTTFKNLLSRGSGSTVVCVIGGAAEALQASPGTLELHLNRRKGFVRQGLIHGTSLVPVIGFGENDIWDVYQSGALEPVQSRLQKLFGFSMPIFFGRGVFTYGFGFLPHRRPINVVVGSAIDLPTIDPRVYKEEACLEDWLCKSEEGRKIVDEHHAKYAEGLMKLYDEYKDVYHKERTSEMVLV